MLVSWMDFQQNIAVSPQNTIPASDLEGDESDEPDPDPTVDDTTTYVDTFVEPSPDDIAAMATERLNAQQQTPFFIREILRPINRGQPICQNSQLWAPETPAQGTPDANSTIISWCSNNAGKQLTSDNPSQYTQYIFDSHSCKPPLSYAKASCSP
jgi:hypothetical protein